MAAWESLSDPGSDVREIIVRLDRPEQLFAADPVDPWSAHYTEYTAQPAMVTVRDMLMTRMPRGHQQVELIVVLPRSACREGLDAELTDAVRRWVRVQNIIDIDTTGADGAIGRRLFVLSAIVFMSLQMTSILVKNLGAKVNDYLNDPVDAIGEGLSVASWVILWVPVQLFTVEAWRASIRRRRSRIIERLNVRVEPVD